ncbi:unnamed protein product [Oikopleura dioica]|uniref:Uncharacterized protein n=1 Tax=Oikopleura dioica TaxID=34765 RepID=E4YE18_OIKDI|nr:unnamed protein product [Oikopleura dioica]
MLPKYKSLLTPFSLFLVQQQRINLQNNLFSIQPQDRCLRFLSNHFFVFFQRVFH